MALKQPPPKHAWVQKEDFLRTASKFKDATEAKILTLEGKELTYKAQDFDKIRFPVAKATIRFPSRGSLYVGDGEYAQKDKARVRTKKP